MFETSGISRSARTRACRLSGRSRPQASPISITPGTLDHILDDIEDLGHIRHKTMIDAIHTARAEGGGT